MTLNKKIAWVDCTSGIAGNMVLGALIDLGFAPAALERLVKILGLGNVKIDVHKEKRQGISGVLVRIISPHQHKERHLKEITRIIRRASLPEPVKEKSLEAFQELAKAEAKIHSVSINDVHFHELGAVDTIVDIVGAVWGFYELGISKIYFSRLNLGGGEIICEHGLLPAPAPATVELLKLAPVKGGSDEDGELTTPTGAVLAKVLADGFGALPEMKIEKTGYGLGERKLKKRANLLRVIYGYALAGAEELIQVEASIDDMNPEYYEPLMKKLLQEGALEVALIPVQFKKSRPGVILRALCLETNLWKVIQTALMHSTTTGLRFFPVQRVCLMRESVPIKTEYGEVRLKSIELPDGSIRVHPEFEDMRLISEKEQIPLTVLEQEVIKEWSKSKRRR